MEPDTTKTSETVSDNIPSLGLVVIVVRNPQSLKYLLIHETNNRGYNLPCGKVDYPENPFQAAHREVLEESGLTVDIKGILRIDMTDPVFVPNAVRIKVIFYAEPKDPNAKLKDFKDKHSEKAIWASRAEILEIDKGKPGLRFRDAMEWSIYIDNGGAIYPTEVLVEEDSEVKMFTEDNIVKLNAKVKRMKKFELETLDEEGVMCLNDEESKIGCDESGNNILMKLIMEGKLGLAKDMLINIQNKETLLYQNSKGESVLEVSEKYCQNAKFRELVKKKFQNLVDSK